MGLCYREGSVLWGLTKLPSDFSPYVFMVKIHTTCVSRDPGSVKRVYVLVLDEYVSLHTIQTHRDNTVQVVVLHCSAAVSSYLIATGCHFVAWHMSLVVIIRHWHCLGSS